MLKRLLELNFFTYTEEVRQGLWNEKKPKPKITKTAKDKKFIPIKDEGIGGLGGLFGSD